MLSEEIRDKYLGPNNLFKLGNPGGGAPPKFETPEEMEIKINEYFDYIRGEIRRVEHQGTDKEKVIWKRKPERATITGLILYMGFACKNSFYEYEKKHSFSILIKKAKMTIEKVYEERLGGTNVTGSIFALKNLGWKDKQEIGFTDSEGKDAFKEKSDEELLELLKKKQGLLDKG